MGQGPHDQLFKETFTHLPSARGELESVLPGALAARIDWSGLRVEAGSFVDETLRERLSDVLLSAPLRRRGRRVRLYLLFEHQSSREPRMAVRMLSYATRALERWCRANPRAKRIPPLVPVLLAHVDSGWTAETSLLELYDFANEEERSLFAPYVPQLRILLDDLSRLSDAELERRQMPQQTKLVLAALRDTRRAGEPENLWRDWRRFLRGLSVTEEGRATISKVAIYLSRARMLDVDRLAASIKTIEPAAEEIVMSTAAQLEARGIEKGRAQGRAEGKAEGKAELLLKLLKVRFGRVPTALRARVVASDEGTLDRVAERVVAGRAIDDLF